MSFILDSQANSVTMFSSCSQHVFPIAVYVFVSMATALYMCVIM